MKLKVNGRTYPCTVSRIGEAQVGDCYVIEPKRGAKYTGAGFAEFESFRPIWEVLYKLGDVLKVRRVDEVVVNGVAQTRTVLLSDGQISVQDRAKLIGKPRTSPRDREIFLFKRKAGI